MKGNTQLERVETRSETIARFVNQFLHERRTSRETIAQLVVEAYHALVPLGARTIEFRTEGDAFACLKTNSQRLWRMLDSSFEETRLPVDLEESLVSALPDTIGLLCKRALARRYGLMDVPLTDCTPIGTLQSLGQFVATFGETVTHLSPILADGQIDASDAPYAALAADDLEHVIATAQGLLLRLRALGANGLVP